MSSNPPPITISTLPRLTSKDLADLLLDPSTASKVAVIDVRDSDHVGGHINGSEWIPMTQLDSRIPELLRLHKDKDKVVFHCMLSQQRGPMAALKFARAKRALDEKDGEKDGKKEGKAPDVCILEGGFGMWQARYGTDQRLTKDYAPDIWDDSWSLE